MLGVGGAVSPQALIDAASARKVSARRRGDPKCAKTSDVCFWASWRAMRLIARYADVWNTWLVSRRANELPALHDLVDAACVRHHREPSTLRRTLGVPVLLDGPTMKWPGVVSGSEEQIAESLRTIAGDRIDEIQLILFPTNPHTVQMIGRVVETATNH